MSVIIRLAGGLGNQMFQYAAAMTVARSRGEDLLLDVRAYEEGGLRAFGLDRWKIRARIANELELKPYTRLTSAFYRRLAGVGIRTRYYVERSLAYDPRLQTMTTARYLEGYFQCARYFERIREQLVADFEPVIPLSAVNADLLELARSTLSVSIHVRRGDYVTVTENADKHGTVGLAYYQAAVSHILDISVNPHWIVFSDDIDWCRIHLKLPGSVRYVDHNGDTPEVDIYLMAQCKHNICANSSFSWWGGWLNSSTSKTVISPRTWFASPRFSSKDLVPSTWVRL